ncbi:MAG: sodium-dependent transporter [Muribaculaceae bacterium]|nr:sodium-dependent transporter [Muribaculaceae bacterium]
MKAKFGSKIGLIAATVGSAVGLGNIWRFPAEAQANGGAAFLLLYIACVFILGIPVMVSEFAIGRGGQSDAVGSLKNLGARRPWWAVGGLAILASYIILWFYMVVAGWTFEYLWQSLTGHLYQSVTSTAPGSTAQFAVRMNEFIANGFNASINTYIVMAVNIAILLLGVQKGIERLSNIMMPMLFVLLLVFCGVSLTLDRAIEGVEFFLRPDFSKITPRVALNALGQAFFSLSLGMGILITYSSYFPSSTKLTRTAVTVSLLDMLVAILMGLIIFPAVMTFNLSGEGLEGASLVFITLPEVFARMPFTRLWSVLFFLLLMLAALTSTISIAEVTIAFLQDRFKLSRVKAVMAAMLPLLVFSTICAYSYSPSFEHIRIAGLTIFDALDYFATNICLPVGSIFLCIYIGWFSPRGFLWRELTNDGTVKSHVFKLMLFIIRYVAPVLIALILVGTFM